MSLPSRNSSYSTIPDLLNESDSGASPTSLSWILNDVPASTTRSFSFPSTSFPTPPVRHLSPPTDSEFDDGLHTRRSNSSGSDRRDPSGQWLTVLGGDPSSATSPLLERKRQRTSDYVDSVGNRSSSPTIPPSLRQREQQNIFSDRQKGYRSVEHDPPSRPAPHLPMATLQNPFSLPSLSALYPSYMPSPRSSIGGPWSGQMSESRPSTTPVDNLRPSLPGPTRASIPEEDSRSLMESRGPGRVTTISRASRACDTCKITKTRCQNGGDTSVACPQCVDKNRACAYTGKNKKRGPSPGQNRRSRKVASTTPNPQVAPPSMAERRGQSLPEVPRLAAQSAYHLAPLQATRLLSTADYPGQSRGFAPQPPPPQLPSQTPRYFVFPSQPGAGAKFDPRASISDGGLTLPPLRAQGWAIPR